MATAVSYVLSGLYILATELLLTLAADTTPTTVTGSTSPQTEGEQAKVSDTSPSTSPSTEAPTTPEPGRSFDGVSFLGGIIFACCCLVVGIVIYKFCIRKKSGDNYGVF